MSELRRERKVVTVLFADLVGFTSRAERMDPEDVEALLGRYHTKVRSELERFGGTVEKFIGDAVMAVFGAPVAHEDDPERAVRGALAVREWARAQDELEVRIGVNTGEAIIRLGAKPEAGESMAVGDVVNTASRLQAAAPTNGILVGSATHRATRQVIDYRETGPVVAKGKSSPVAAWEAVDARTPVGFEAERAPRTKLVGRQRELGLLRDAFERARQERELQLVTLVGVPGIGKSRIVHELSRILAADPQMVTWRRGSCPPYGRGVSFRALSEMIKAEAGILESDEPPEAAAKLAAAVAAVIPESDATWVEGRLRPLIDLTGPGETGRASREEAFPAWCRFLTGVAERRPAVLVFEDLHWADEGLLDFLEELVTWSTGFALLVVCTARPDLLDKRPAWGGGRTNAVTLSLPPLSRDETALLVRDLLGQTNLPPDTERALLERAGGNPLYAEEFARMFSERSTGELALPEAVQGIIAARLDTLAPAQKHLVQDAAVVGKVFWAGAAAALDGADREALDAALRELERRELVRREPKSRVAGETEYVFRHALVRDVAYGQIPRAERGDRHRLVAEWIASLGRPDEHAELLAHHYQEALEYARAANRDTAELAKPARAALHRAGERAAALGAYEAATRYFRATLDLVGEDDPERAELLYHQGAAQFWWDATGDQILVEATKRLAVLGRSELAARAALLLARLAWMHGDRPATDVWMAEVDRLLAGVPESTIRTEALVARSGYQMVSGENDSAISGAREALALIEGLDRSDLRARAFDIIGTSRVNKGDEQGMDEQIRAIDIARVGHAGWELHHAINNLGVAKIMSGRLNELDELIQMWRTTHDQGPGTAYNRAWFIDSQSFADYFAGRWDSAVERIDAFLAALPGGTTHYLEPDMRPLRAMIAFARDNVEEAVADLDRSVEVARLSKDPQTNAPALCVRSAILLAAGRSTAAGADFDGLLAMGPAAASAMNAAGLLPTFAWLSLDLGRVNEAHRLIDSSRHARWTHVARAILAEDGATAAQMLGDIGHRPAEAYARLRAGADHLHGALDFYRSVGAVRHIRDAESQLAAPEPG